MLINPYLYESRELLKEIPGTNIICTTLDIVGLTVTEPGNAVRRWVIQNLYLPVPGRALGGIRAKLIDQKGFITFCNQRDLEVLLGIARPGSYCPWLDRDYVGPSDSEWFGLCTDEEDLVDDLCDRELEERAMHGEGLLPPGLQLHRRVHAGRKNDYEELLVLNWDMDPDTGIGPDTRIETIMRRWSSVERTGRAERERLWLRS